MRSRPYQTTTIALDAARDLEEYNLPGSYISIRGASSATAAVTVRFDHAGAPAITMLKGHSFRNLPFDRLFLSWIAQPGQWIEIITAGEPSDYRPGQFEASIEAAIADVAITGPLPLPVSLASLPIGETRWNMRPPELVLASGESIVTAGHQVTNTPAALLTGAGSAYQVGVGKVLVIASAGGRADAQSCVELSIRASPYGRANIEAAVIVAGTSGADHALLRGVTAAEGRQLWIERVNGTTGDRVHGWFLGLERNA